MKAGDAKLQGLMANHSPMAASCQVDFPALSDVRDIDFLAAAQKRKLFLFFWQKRQSIFGQNDNEAFE